ncbi:MAG: hypothetical protein Q9N34_08100 [Aquificota bacterium]|nr:hypothetical protein [Aquificota bacterium]
MGRFSCAEGRRLPFLKVSTNLFYRVFEGDECSEVKIYRGEELRGLGISLEPFSQDRIGDRQLFHPFFPFSAYGGLYAHEFLSKRPEGENIFEIEPLYLKPPV